MAKGNRGVRTGVGNKKKQKQKVAYTPYAMGQITKYEAGTIYKASKNGNIKVKNETVKWLYDSTNSYIKTAIQRYSQDPLTYDRIYRATWNILNGMYKEAQREIDLWEKDMVKYSTKKSTFYKYRNKM